MVDPLDAYDLLLLDLDSLPDATADADEDEEEDLEWLSNKDAFPSLDTSAFLSPSPSPLPPSHFLVPVKPRTKGRRRKRRDLRGFVTAAAAATPERKKEQRRKCTHCEAEETPQWRAGPDGPRTLCNACGVRYKSGRLVPEYRPASSPSFSPAIHSNSHRRILEMRRRRPKL